jgi:hypothetical protein
MPTKPVEDDWILRICKNIMKFVVATHCRRVLVLPHVFCLMYTKWLSSSKQPVIGIKWDIYQKSAILILM